MSIGKNYTEEFGLSVTFNFLPGFFLGAGNYPRHTHMLEQLSAGHHKENSRFAHTTAGSVDLGGLGGSGEEDSPLWRADWGLKQWVPYLLGMTLYILY